jgi:DNA polymerase-3 subunit epsilon
MPDFNFTAFDFETATYNRMPCQLGIVRVENGEIIEKNCFLIQPPGNAYDQNCINVHLITPEMTQDAPTFSELWPKIKHYFDFQTVVAHSIEFDLDVLNKIIHFYNIDNHHILGHQCTKELFDNHALVDVCTALNIPVSKHHDALSDAIDCALIFMEYLKGINIFSLNYPERKDRTSFESHMNLQGRHLSSDVKHQDLSIVKNKDTPFYDKKIVITGVFSRYPEREELAKIFKSFGADNNGAISKRTDIVCVGAGFGPSKLKTVEQLISDGYPIQILHENELYKILDDIL